RTSESSATSAAARSGALALHPVLLVDACHPPFGEARAAGWIPLRIAEPSVERGDRLRHVEKRVGSLLEDDLLKAAIERNAFCLVELAPIVDQNLVGGGVLEGDHVPAAGHRLARMPNLVEIGVGGRKLPAEDHRVVVELLDLLEQN